MERRKFLQLIVVGVVALAAKITGGLGVGPEQPESQGGYAVPENLNGGKAHLAGKPCLIQFTQTPEDPDSWVDLSNYVDETEVYPDMSGWDKKRPVEYIIAKSKHYRFADDQTAWKFTRRKSPPFVYPGPAFVILEPSEQMVKELEGLKAQSISILATYHD